MKNRFLFYFTIFAIVSGVILQLNYLKKIKSEEDNHPEFVCNIKVSEPYINAFPDCSDDYDSQTLTIYTTKDELKKIYKGQNANILSKQEENEPEKTYKGKIIYISKVTEPVPAFKDLDYSQMYMSRKVIINMDNKEYCNDKNPKVILTKEIITE